MGKKKKKKDKPIRKPVANKPVQEPVAPPVAKKSFKVPIVLAVFLVAAISAAVIFYRGKAVRAGGYKNYNVVLITMDTTRADHLPAYGYKGVKTPNLDQLASHGFIFDDAISHAPLTLPSHTSILTGLLPIAHGIRDNAGYFVDKKTVTLAEILKTHGYATSAFVSAFILDSRWGLNKGFDLYYDNFILSEINRVNTDEVQRPGAETEAEAEEWLNRNKDRHFFSWIHLYDPHAPYEPPDPYKTEYADHPYDGEIAYTDMVIGRLLKKLKELKIDDHTIVIITGDHGEGLGEHQEITHAMFIYNATLHVPLLMKIPGARGMRVKGVVRHIDIAPTILELLGITVPKEIQGSSLLPMMNGKTDTNRVAYSESLYADIHYGWSSLKSVTTDQYKYIEAPKAELYDRIKDPGETNNLIADRSAYAKVLREKLDEIIAKYTNKNVQTAQKMDPETEERLRALGYVGGSAQSTPESRQIDPKDKIGLARDLQLASNAISAQNYETALNYLYPILEQDPKMTDAHFFAGTCYIATRQVDKGIDELLKTLSLRPDYTMALYDLGYAYELKKDLKEAEKWYLKVLQYEPKQLHATLELAHVYRQMDEPEKARPYFLQAMRVYERFLNNAKNEKSKSNIYSTIGELYFGVGNLLQAEENYKAAVALTPNQNGLHYALAEIYEAQGNFPSALDAYKQEVQIDPRNYKAFNNLGILFRESRQLDNAITCFQKVVDLLPQDPRGYILLASTYKQMGRDQEAMRVIQEAQARQVSVDR